MDSESASHKRRNRPPYAKLIDVSGESETASRNILDFSCRGFAVISVALSTATLDVEKRTWLRD